MTGDVLTVTNNSSCSQCSISWSVILIKYLTKGGTIFGVGRETPYSVPLYPMEYDVINSNPSDWWSTTSNSFMAPVTGFYFLSITTAALPGGISRHKIYINGVVEYKVRCENQIYLSVGSSGMSYLEPLQAGTVLNVEGVSAGSTTDFTQQAAFSGFLYHPLWGAPTAWAASRETEWPSSDPPSPFGYKLDTSIFNVIYFNINTTNRSYS